jgi:hypothetical protein
MLIFILLNAWSRPNHSWLSKQIYTHRDLLPNTLNKQEKALFLEHAHRFLVDKYQHADFSCRNHTAVHYPFPNEHIELQKTYALETSVCIPDMNWNEAYQQYMNPTFRTNHMPGVEQATRNQDTICITSESFIGVMKPAYMCLTSIENKFQHGVLLYSHLTKSKSAPFQPVYFQEEYILFEQMDTNTLIYRLSVNRSRELGTAGTYILRKKSQEYPQQLIEAMKSKQK